VRKHSTLNTKPNVIPKQQRTSRLLAGLRWLWTYIFEGSKRLIRRVRHSKALHKAYLRMQLAPLDTARPIPATHRANFMHLYFDIAWFGVLAGSAQAFAAVYATRQGADAFQLGMLSAGPAIVGILFAIPASHWVERQHANRATVLSAHLNRIGYLLWALLPNLFMPQGQIWALIGLTLLMAFPGTALSVSFNALFADAVPLEWRSYVAGVRNAVFAITYMISSLLCGFLLDTLSFPTGYQVVFALGFLGSLLSTIHLGFVHPTKPKPTPANTMTGGFLTHSARPARVQRRRLHLSTRLQSDVLAGDFAKVLALLFAFHLTQYIAIPIYPLYTVGVLQLTDQELSIGMALFYIAFFIGAIQLDRLTQKSSNCRVTAVGALLMSSYPFLLSMSQGLGLYLVTSTIGGFAWSLAGGALNNYLLEYVPTEKRAAGLAWYNLALNTAILLGSLLGSLSTDIFGLTTALILFAISRFLSAVIILRWG